MMQAFLAIPVGKKLSVLIVGVTVVALAAVSVVWLRLDRSRVDTELIQDLEVLAGVIGNSSVVALQSDDAAQATRTLSALEANPQIYLAALFGPGNELLAKYSRPENTWPVPVAGPVASELPHQPLRRFQEMPPEIPIVDQQLMLENRIAIFRNLYADGRFVGKIHLLASLRPIQERQRQATLVFVGLLTVTAILIAGVSTLVVQRLLSRPLRALSAISGKNIGRNQQQLRFGRQGGDEFAAIGQHLSQLQQALQSRDNDLAKSRLDLDDKVESRTAKLRKQTVEFKHAAEEARQAALQKSEFLASMRHEIRPPMNAIIGMTELVLGTALSEEQRQHLMLTRSSADKLTSIINDILDFADIDAGNLDLVAADFRLRDALADSLSPLGFRADEKGVELAYCISPEVPDALVGDPGKLRQIVVHLVDNALKYTDTGEVLLDVKIDTADTEEVVLHFAVVDTGIGIPNDQFASVFESFRQVDNATEREAGGTGLGLAVCSQLVELMGGRIWFESELGSGSTFHFTLKFRLAGIPEDERQTAQVEHLLNLPVLLVDHDSNNSKILQETLSGWGMQTVAVDSGTAALDALRHRAASGSELFRIIVVDGPTPGMDDFSLVEEIRGLQQLDLSDVRFMMITSAGQRGDAARCKEVGIDAYLTKPVEHSALLESLLMLIRLETVVTTEQPSLITRHKVREERQPLYVLIAADNQITQKLAVRILEQAGHTTRLTDDAERAIELFQAEAFDLLLIDVELPEALQATGIIGGLREQSGNDVPIVALIRRGAEADAEGYEALGFDETVSTPIQRKKLFHVLDSITDARDQQRVAGASDEARWTRWMPTDATSGPAAETTASVGDRAGHRRDTAS